MKRLSATFIISLFLIIQPIGAQHSIPSQQAQPSHWLAWFKSVRVPNKEDARKAQAYIDSKWRCLRYGENCSKKERAVLMALATLVAATIAKLASSIYWHESKPTKRILNPIEKPHIQNQEAVKIFRDQLDKMRKDLETSKILKQAVFNRDPKAIQAVLKGEIDLNIDQNQTLLVNVVDHIGLLKKFLDAGVDPNVLKADVTPLLNIVHFYRYKIAAEDTIPLLLKNKKFNINAHYQGAKALKILLNMPRKIEIKIAKILSPYIDIMKDEQGKTGVEILNDMLTTGHIKQKQYDQLMRYSRGKKEFIAALTPKEKNILYTLPLELRAKVFEDVTGMPLSEKQLEKVMRRSHEKK